MRLTVGRWSVAAIGALAAIGADPAWAHSRCFVLPYAGEATPWWTWWSLEPLLMVNGALLAGLYAVGLRRMWRRAGIGRGIPAGRAIAFASGLLVLALALGSPLDALGGQLAWAHMVQHMALMVGAAPLLMLGRPGLAIVWALPEPLRRRLARRRARALAARWGTWLWQPLVLWGLFALMLWLWHVPALYEAALARDGVHALQHLAFLGAACLYWRVLLDPLGRRWLPPLLGVMYLFTTSLHATLLGVFMALAPAPWYPAYARTAPAWRLTALADQQLAGLIMWMPACMVFALAAAWLFAGWLAAFQTPKGRPGPPDEGRGPA